MEQVLPLLIARNHGMAEKEIGVVSFGVNEPWWLKIEGGEGGFNRWTAAGNVDDETKLYIWFCSCKSLPAKDICLSWTPYDSDSTVTT